MTDRNRPVFLVTGLGEGTGGATARRFAKGGYRVAMLARSKDRLDKFETELPESKGYPCDVADLEHLVATIDQVKAEMGPPEVVLHNAVGDDVGVDPRSHVRRAELQVAAAEENGTRVLPEYGSAFISMNGRDAASARTHITIAVPGATTESTGLPDNPRSGGAWIMDAGTTTAHIMIPGT